MLTINSIGTVRNGQHGTIAQVFSNGAVFHGDNGTEFVILNEEFTPDSATESEKKEIAKTQAAMFPADGAPFHYIHKIAKHGDIEEIQVRALKHAVQQ